MSEVVEIEASSTGMGRRIVLGADALGILVALVTVALIVAVSVMSGLTYHLLAYGVLGPVAAFVSAGCLAGLIYVLPQIYREELSVEARLARPRGRLNRAAGAWIGAFAVLMLIGFLTKTTEIFSRGWGVLFFVSGGLLVLALENVLVRMLRWMQRAGRIRLRRLMLIGSVAEIARFFDAQNAIDGFDIAARLTLDAADLSEERRGRQSHLRETIKAAVVEARRLHVDDILVLNDGTDRHLMKEIVDEFSLMPIAVHIPAKGFLETTGRLELSRIGGQPTLSVFSRPLTYLQACIKRGFDILTASVALVILSPLLAAVAVLIKLDSKGPVLFRQRRRGYNHHEFAILKFRTMTTMDDGDVVQQARKNDLRITRVGRYLRKANIDELPQLWNVLVGEMSIVGPRPHAVAHDRMFEQRIIAYARRLNVRPGITGWAQVNGLRGETETDDKMRQRVEYDLAYIDNWSLGLDIYILILTVLSPRSYRNAG
jgi:Undecaprenyl-phosphate glucose phosphotransferase